MARRSISGSRMLITGASQGIGKSLAELAAARGAQVVAVARSEGLLNELSEQIRNKGGTLHVVLGDVTNPADRQKMVDDTVKRFGGLDILVNNAGIGATGHFADVSPDRLRKIMEVNFFAVTELTRLFLPILKRGNRPAIVNISSIAGKRGIPARSEYSASKFAIQGFSEAIRAELAKDGIDVVVVCPGLTQTNFSQNMIEQKALLKYDHLRGMTAEQVALATLKAIERGTHEVCLSLQGRLLVTACRFFPWLGNRVARRKVLSLFAEEIAARRQKKLAAIAGTR